MLWKWSKSIFLSNRNIFRIWENRLYDFEFLADISWLELSCVVSRSPHLAVITPSCLELWWRSDTKTRNQVLLLSSCLKSNGEGMFCTCAGLKWRRVQYSSHALSSKQWMSILHDQPISANFFGTNTTTFFLGLRRPRCFRFLLKTEFWVLSAESCRWSCGSSFRARTSCYGSAAESQNNSFVHRTEVTLSWWFGRTFQMARKKQTKTLGERSTVCIKTQHKEHWVMTNMGKSEMMYSKFRTKLLANDSSIFLRALIAEYYCARGAQVVKAIRLLSSAVIWWMLYLVISTNSLSSALLIAPQMLVAWWKSFTYCRLMARKTFACSLLGHTSPLVHP